MNVLGLEGTFENEGTFHLRTRILLNLTYLETRGMRFIPTV